MTESRFDAPFPAAALYSLVICRDLHVYAALLEEVRWLAPSGTSS